MAVKTKRVKMCGQTQNSEKQLFASQSSV